MIHKRERKYYERNIIIGYIGKIIGNLHSQIKIINKNYYRLCLYKKENTITCYRVINFENT